MFAAAVMGPSPSGGGAFDPESDISWHSLFWAEGTNFVAQGYTDTDAVTTWPNETGETDATEATNPPSYSATGGPNSQPAVDFDGSEFLAGTFSAAPSYASGGVSIVVVGTLDTTSDQTIVDSVDNPANDQQRIFAFSGVWRLRSGSAAASATSVDTNDHLWVATFDSSGNDTLALDGVEIIDGDAGNETMTGVTLGARNDTGANMDGRLALVGVYEGDVQADGNWSAFESWVTSHYGITIS